MAFRRRARPPLIGLLFSLAGWSLATSLAWSQLPTPELQAVFPPGGPRGQSVEVSLSGANLEGVKQLLFSHPGIQAEPKPGPRNELLNRDTVVPNVFVVRIAGDVPPGSYEAQAVGYFGVSNSRIFRVGVHPEVNENGANNSAASAQTLELNTVVNGRSNGAAGDFYRVALEAGQRVVATCAAKQLDSQMDPVLVLSDEAGHELALSQDDRSADPLLDFTAPASGAYVIEVHDFLFEGGGNHFYRFLVHTDPQIDQIFPPVLIAGQLNQVLVIGRNLPSAQPLANLTLNGLELQQTPQSIAAPPLAPHLPPAGPVDPAPLEAALWDGFEHRWREDMAPVRLGLTRDPIVIESEPNNDPAQANQLTPPCEAVGRLYGDADQDWYQFTASKGDVLWIDVLLHRLGWPADATLLVQRITKNDKGEEQVQEIAFVDDPGDRPARIGSDFDASTDDPIYRFTAPEEGTYRLRVTDNFDVGANDPRVVYRLRLRHESPDFRLLVQPNQIKVANNNQVLLYSPVLRRGDAIVVEVAVERRDGFNGNIELVAEGLPAGVQCPGAIIPAGANSAWLSFTATTDAALGEALVQVVGRGEHQGKRLTRYAVSGAVVWGTGNKGQSAAVYRTSQFRLSIAAEAAPALVTAGNGLILETSKGGTLEVPLQVARRGEFKEALKLAAVGLPNELKPAEVTINGDQESGTLTLALTNAKAQPGLYTFFLRSDVKIKYSRNPESLQAAEADQKQLTMLVAQAQEQMQQAATSKTEAQQSVQQLEGQFNEADSKSSAAAATLAAAAKAMEQADQNVQAARKAAEEQPNNAELQQALQNAESALSETRKQMQVAASEHQQMLETKNALAKQLEQNRQTAAAAEKAEQDAQARAKQVTEAKAAQDKQVEEVKKAVAPKDLDIAVVSPAILLRVTPTPLSFQGVSREASLTAGQPLELPVVLEKKYGFNEPIEISLEPPANTAISAEKITLPAGQEQGALIIQCDPKLSGDFPITLKATAKFNNVPVEAATTMTLHVAAPAAK